MYSIIYALQSHIKVLKIHVEEVVSKLGYLVRPVQYRVYIPPYLC